MTDVDDHRLRRLLVEIDGMEDGDHEERARLADTRDGAVYRVTEEITTALKVALVTGRPILMMGPPGCGKSSLAPYVARNLDFAFVSYTVTDASEPADLLWQVDHVQRLNDAQLPGKDLEPDEAYVRPGVLWQAFEPSVGRDAVGPVPVGTVVLVDELDKADASFANSLLVAVGSLQFDVPPLRRVVEADRDRVVLTIFTSNNERVLPPAFLRRCITVQVDYPSADDLIEVARRYWPTWMGDDEFAAAVDAMAKRLADAHRSSGPAVSTGEFLDLVQALHYIPGTGSGAATSGADDDEDEGIAVPAVPWDLVEQLILLRPQGE